MPEYNFETVKVTFPAPFVAHVELNRPKKMNAINGTMWFDIRSVFDTLRDDPDVRAIVLSGAGRCFTSGLDRMSLYFSELPLLYDDVASDVETVKKLTSSNNSVFVEPPYC
jgi:delta(3,5)-delta(2,4)-dienoyl-CoA isomerase